MEDTYFLDADFGGKGWIFGGVYDGHLGGEAAKFAAENLHKVFRQRLSSDQDPKEAFIETYQKISNQLKHQDSGTTAVNFFIKDRKIFCANVGDARVIIIGKGKVVPLTVDHRLSNPKERKRVEKLGGRIDDPYLIRGFQGIMPTRTLGDEYFKSVGVIATPDVNEHKISAADTALIVGSDGLFDIISDGEIPDFAERFPDPKELLAKLKEEAFKRGCFDNLTVIAVTWADKSA